jgi:hypothetical protein
MIDINQVMQRDQLVQYLAFYTATKGLMVELDFEVLKKLFVEYKMNLMRNEYTLEWLVNDVMMKYAILPEKVDTSKLAGLVVVPKDFLNHLINNDPRLSQQSPQHDKTQTTTLEPPEGFHEVFERLGVALDPKKLNKTELPPKRKPGRPKKI